MRTIIYLIIALVGLTGTITGTIKLVSFNISQQTIIQTFFITLFCMGLFTLFGYAFVKHYKELLK